MTRMRIKHTDQEWLDLIQECMTCGLTITDWCRQQDITNKAFYYHVNQLRRKGYDIPHRMAPVRSQEKREPFFVDIKDTSAESSRRILPDAHAAVIRIDFHGVAVKIKKVVHGSVSDSPHK